MKLPMFRGALAVIFWPSYAKRISEEHHKYLNSPETMKRSESEEPWPHKQITNLRSAWLNAFAMVIVVLAFSSLLGIVLANCLGGPTLQERSSSYAIFWRHAAVMGDSWSRGMVSTIYGRKYVR